jgi:hypothetical protein
MWGLMGKILLVHEFPASEDEWMMPGLQAAFSKRESTHLIFTFHGLFHRYTPGTLRPSRLLNLCYMSLALPVILLFRRPSLSVVRSAPVGLHLWAAIWLRLLRLRGVCWLMDYHPEIEIRSLGRRAWGRPIAALLRSWDRFALRSYRQIIVLDPAMERAVKERYPEANVLTFPTWPRERPADIPTDWQHLPTDARPITLLYGGHLGAGHGLEVFSRLLAALAARCPVRLLVVGANEEGVQRFRDCCDGVKNVTLESLPRVPFEELPKLARENRVHYGLILMKEELKGLLSPSKFAGYLASGIPTLYFGPEGTNADRVCREFGGGLSIRDTFLTERTENAEEARILELVDRILSEEQYGKFLEGTRWAGEYFFAFTPDRLAEMIEVGD